MLFWLAALISVKTKAKTAVEGQDFYFSCKYKDGQGVNTKYFSHDESSTPLILTDKHDQWVSIGRFSLYDNTSGSFFMVRISNLKLEDSGKYWCGVDVPSNADKLNEIQLNVTRGTVVFPINALIFHCSDLPTSSKMLLYFRYVQRSYQYLSIFTNMLKENSGIFQIKTDFLVFQALNFHKI